MLEPKKTLVGLAGQKAWHNCAGEAAPRISGKYLPSQLRTQKAGPELTTTGRGGGDCGLLLKRSPERSAAVASGRHRKRNQASLRPHSFRASAPRGQQWRQQQACGAACAERTIRYATLAPPDRTS